MRYQLSIVSAAKSTEDDVSFTVKNDASDYVIAVTLFSKENLLHFSHELFQHLSNSKMEIFSNERTFPAH